MKNGSYLKLICVRQVKHKYFIIQLLMSSVTLIRLLCRCMVFHLDLKVIHLAAVDVPAIASQLSADIE